MQVAGHISEEAINRYHAHALSPAEFLAAQAHIFDCAECRLRLERAVNTDAVILNFQSGLTPDHSNFQDEPEHLPYEQLAFYLDGQLDEVEREIAESHLAICLECADDLADLRRYQSMTVVASTGIASSAASSTAAAQPTGAETQTKDGSWWRRFAAFDFLPSFGALAPSMAAAAIVLAVILLGVWLALRSNSPNSNEVARTQSNVQETATPLPVMPPPAPANVNASPDNATPNSNSSQAAQPPQSPITQPPPRNPAPTDASLLVALNDADGRVTLDGQGNVRGLESLSPSDQAAVRNSLKEQRAQTPQSLSALTEGETAVLMNDSANASNGGAPFTLHSPVGVVVRDAQPTLRWRPLAGANSYSVAIVDARFRVVAQSPRLTATEWTPDKPLARGMNYSWQVTAIQADGAEVVSPVSPAPQAKFRVMEESAFEEVTRLENSGVRSHLARGVIYAKAGLLDQARAEFAALVRDNPRSRLARKLLDSVKKQ